LSILRMSPAADLGNTQRSPLMGLG
jgi:hypothetical protein